MNQITLIDLYNGLKRINNTPGSSGKKSFECMYGIKKNLQLIKPEMDIFLEQETEASVSLKDFKAAQQDVYIKHATIDGAVKYKQEGTFKLYDVPESATEALSTEIKELKEKFKEEIIAAENKMKELFETRSSKQSTVALYYISKKDIPVDIDEADLNVLFPLITE